jgi:hypothetical protein
MNRPAPLRSPTAATGGDDGLPIQRTVSGKPMATIRASGKIRMSLCRDEQLWDLFPSKWIMTLPRMKKETRIFSLGFCQNITKEIEFIFFR